MTPGFVAAVLEGFESTLDAVLERLDAVDLRREVEALQEHIRVNSTLYFTQRGTLDQPLPTTYGDIVKCWLILDRRSVINMSRRLDTARILWDAIQQRRRGNARAFAWQNFSEEDLSQAELLMRASWNDSTTYKLIVRLLVFARFLASRGICRPLYYTPQTPRVEDLNRHMISGQQERRDRLPTDAALHGIADIYREHAKEPADRLRAAAVAILVVTGASDQRTPDASARLRGGGSAWRQTPLWNSLLQGEGTRRGKDVRCSMADRDRRGVGTKGGFTRFELSRRRRGLVPAFWRRGHTGFRSPAFTGPRG